MYIIHEKVAHAFRALTASKPMKYSLMLQTWNLLVYVARLQKKSIKAETHSATNRSDTSQRQVASSALLLRQVACPCFVAAICRTNSNQFKFVRQIAATNSVAATMIFTCHTRRFVAATCRGNVSQRFVASCVSAFILWRTLAKIVEEIK